MLSAQATALPSLSSVTKLVEAGRGGSAAPGRSGVASTVWPSTPPARQRAATANARAAAAPSAEGSLCSTENAAAAARPPSAGGGRNATLSLRYGRTIAGEAWQGTAQVGHGDLAGACGRSRLLNPARQDAGVEVAHPPIRICVSVEARSGCDSVCPSASGVPFGANTARALGSANSGPATRVRSRTRARVAGVPKRANCSAGTTRLSNGRRP